jgi:copper resistance protein B
MMNKTTLLAATATVLIVSGSVFAQAAPAGAADHGAHHGATTTRSERASPPSEAAPTASDPPSVAPAPATGEQPAMDHGEMQMQGGSPPADARDPHAYSDGFVRGSGKYSLEPGLRLRLGDEHRYSALLVNRLERSYGEDDNATAYDAQAWFGTSYDRLVVKAEGERSRGELEHARTELLWGHALAAYWDAQLGIRYDSGEGPNREWLAVGIQGLAPYWFELDATAYLGASGRTALRFEAEYELLVTQRLILQPRIEVNAYGKSDRDRGIGSGLSDAAVGLRLRYEITRQFAPYIGVEWVNRYGETKDLARQAGGRGSDTRLVAGIRFWF